MHAAPLRPDRWSFQRLDWKAVGPPAETSRAAGRFSTALGGDLRVNPAVPTSLRRGRDRTLRGAGTPPPPSRLRVPRAHWGTGRSRWGAHRPALRPARRSGLASWDDPRRPRAGASP